MTQLQKRIISILLEGGSIAKYPNYPYRLCDEGGNVVLKLGDKTFQLLKHLLREEKYLFVINKNEVRKLRGNAWANKYYKSLKTKNYERKRPA